MPSWPRSWSLPTRSPRRFRCANEIDTFNARQADRALILKIGIHRGAAIAVTLNERLDYFGQTVNIAARVQQLADADEIFVSEDAYSAEGVQALLGSPGSRIKRLQAEGRATRHARVPCYGMIVRWRERTGWR